MNTTDLNNNQNFKASIKLTPYTKKMVLGLSDKHKIRFFESQKKLSLLDSTDELLLSRKKTLDGKVIPILINLKTGSMIAELTKPNNKFITSAIELIESVANQKNNFTKKIFTKNQTVIDENISKILNETKELSIHPAAQQKLNHIELEESSQILMKQFEKIYPNKEIKFKLSENEKLFIKSYDEGYIYYICNNNNIPTGKYFTVTYNKDGYILNYNKNFLEKEKVEKYYTRYTKKAIENLSR